MILLGKHHTLSVTRLKDFGAYLDAGTLGEILLPRKFVPEGLQVGQSLRVFLYQDSEDRLVATTQQPLIELGGFAALKVVDRNPVGAFLDWGLDKDLLVPYPEQYRPMEVGRYYIVTLYVDRVHGRLTASSRVDRFLDRQAPRYRPRQAVDLLIASRTDLGYKCIVDDRHWGLLHQVDVSRPLHYGQRVRGSIKQQRADGKLDLVLRTDRAALDDFAARILQALREADGFLPLHDKSDARQIQAELGMSKTAFKKAVGGLLREGRIELEAQGIRLRQAAGDEQDGATSVWGRPNSP